MRTALLLLLLLPAVCVAQPLKGPEVQRERGITTLTFDVPLGGGDEDAVVWIRRGEETALKTPFAVAAQGPTRIVLRTARLLLPGEYVLEVLPSAKAPLLSHAFRLGSEGDAQAAEERMDRWYLGAARTFRALTATLERRGAWHRAVAEADGERRAEQQERFEARFLPGWQRALRQARMDLSTYQRRLLLPPRPELGAALLELVEVLLARSKAWVRALQPFAAAPPPNAEAEALAQRLLAALPGLGTLGDWRAGPLGTPPAPAEPGARFQSPLGFALTVPAGATLHSLTGPSERLSFAADGVEVRVRVAERPDATTRDALTRAVEVDAWESWESYKRLTAKPLEGGLRLEFTARTAGRSVRVRQVTRFPAQGGRLLTLLVFRAPDGEWPASLEALEASFQVTAR